MSGSPTECRPSAVSLREARRPTTATCLQFVHWHVGCVQLKVYYLRLTLGLKRSGQMGLRLADGQYPLASMLPDSLSRSTSAVCLITTVLGAGDPLGENFSFVPVNVPWP